MALIGPVRVVTRWIGRVTLMLLWTFIQVSLFQETVHTDARRPPRNDQTLEKPPRLLKIATIQREPFVQLRYQPGLIANDRYEGMYVDLLKEVARQADFQYQLYLVPDGKIGQTGEDRRWNGLIGELNRGMADLALAPIAVTAERNRVVSFTAPLWPVKVSALSRPPAATGGHDAIGNAPYGIVVNSEAYFALRSNRDYFDQLRQTIGLIFVNSIMEGLFRAREGDLRLLVTSQMAEYYSDQEPCDLVAQEFYSFTDLHFSLATREPGDLLDEINAVLRRLATTTPFMDELEQRWFRGSCRRHGTLPTLSDATTNIETAAGKRQLVITSVMVAPYLMRSNKRGVEFEGYIADIIRQMAKVVPFDYEWRIQQRVGKQRNDGTWSGMIGDLMTNKADLAAAPFDHKQERMISQSKPFLESTLSIVIQKPSNNDDLPFFMVEDLLNQTTYDFGIVHKSAIAKHLRKSKSPLYKKLWRKLKAKDKENAILSIRDGLVKVREGNFALILESTDATYLSSKQPCDLLSISQYLSVTNYAFAAAINSPLVDDLNNALLQLQEDGVLQALFHKWWNTDECMDDSSEEETTEAQSTTTPVPRTTTPAPTLAPLRPDFDMDLDALLGLSTDSPPLSEDAEEYEHIGDEDSFDIARLFLTSPVSAFTPQRSVTDRTPIVSVTIPVLSEPPHPSSMSSTVPENPDISKTSNKTEMNMVMNETRNFNDSANQPTPSGSLTYTVSPLEVTPPTTLSPMQTTTKKRRNRTRKPGRRKNRKRTKATTQVTPSTSSPPARTPRDKSRDFNKDIDWFFATEQPRPEDYDFTFNDSNNQSDRYSPYFPSKNNNNNVTPHVINSDNRVTNTTVTLTTEGSASVAPPSGGTSKAVLFIVIIHLLIFGWPAHPQECIEDCSR